ncbi:unnamed protein product [Brassica napus]|uniref:(rape) hypothetical protein n=1 Tax=Brassica napus TaxID=3708 RepID=A0A816J9F1_BRANA|nr:unnamed protein product [Brassica napus]
MMKKELLFLTSLIVLCVFISSIDAKTKSIHYPGEDCDPRFPTAECRERCLKSDRCRGGTDSIPPLKQFLQKFLKDLAKSGPARTGPKLTTPLLFESGARAA